MIAYEIRVKGHLDQHWSAWFDGLAISYDADEHTMLRGPLIDEAALHGVLNKVRDLGVPLLPVNQVAVDSSQDEQGRMGSNTGDATEGAPSRLS
jgi:hypothetical protein